MPKKVAVLDTERLQQYMEQHELNTSEMAEKIGVSPSVMSRVLNNKRDPSGLVWSGLIGYLGRKVFNYIFFADDVSKDTKNKEGAHEQIASH